MRQPIKFYQRNVDPDEIARFNSIANRWWNLEGEFKLLHRINPLRLDYILERTSGLFDKNVLDVGCGGGILSESMAREGAKVTGLDVSVEALLVANLHAFKNNMTLEYHHQTVEEHAKTHYGIYDVVTCMEMLEHTPNPESIIQACSHLVRAGGEVFFSTLNRSFKAWLIAIVGAEYILRMLPKGSHDITKFIKPAELLGWINNTSLHERHIIGLHYNLMRDCFYLSESINVNYILHTQRQA